MAKRKKKKYSLEDEGLPPEGLWISPEGDQIEVIEHLMALGERPDLFSLTEQDIYPPTVEHLRDVAVGLIRQGWTRFRYLAGVWANFPVRAEPSTEQMEVFLKEERP